MFSAISAGPASGLCICRQRGVGQRSACVAHANDDLGMAPVEFGASRGCGGHSCQIEGCIEFQVRLKTGTLNSERCRSSVAVFSTPRLVRETPGRCRVLRIRGRLRRNAVGYGEGRSEKGLRTATWPLISLTTSAARLVLSSTNPLTKNAGMVMSRASPHTTMSFTPIERDLRFALQDLTAIPKDHSQNSSLMQSTLHCKVIRQKN